MVIQILENPDNGGAERVAQLISDILTSRNIDNKIYYSKAQGINEEDIRNDDKIAVHSLRMLINFKLLFSKNKKYFFYHFRYNLIKRILIWFTTLFNVTICFVGPVGRRDFKFPCNCKEIYNSVPPFKPIKTNELCHRIGWVGSIKPGKNWEHFVELVRRNKNLEVSFHMVCNGPGLKDLREMIARENLDICIHDTLTNVQEIYSTFDLLIYTAHNNYEMMPMVLLEASASNTKVLAYNSDINRFFFNDDELVNLGDEQDLDRRLIDMRGYIPRSTNFEEYKSIVFETFS
jgi:glycosyltransferase involved in cell wall biosynthesis